MSTIDDEVESRRDETTRPKVVVITGATAGVGRATAWRFAEEGARIALLARGAEALRSTALEVSAGGGHPLPISVDVADAGAVFAAADRIERELGPIDVWINNAMTTVFGRVEDVTPEEWRRVTDVTYHGVVWGTQAALAKMRPRGRGTIIQVGSALAYRAIPLQAAYCGAKHAIRAFTDALRCELIHEGTDIHLCMVQLPAVNTPQFRQCTNKMPFEPQPVPPIFQPEIPARAIHYASRRRLREIYVGAPTVNAVAGQKIAPGLMDRYLARAAYETQFTREPRNDARPSNLFEPVPGDHGAHGVFDDRARPEDTLATITSWLGAAGVRVLLLLLSPLWLIYSTVRLAMTAPRTHGPAPR